MVIMNSFIDNPDPFQFDIKIVNNQLELNADAIREGDQSNSPSLAEKMIEIAIENLSINQEDVFYNLLLLPYLSPFSESL